MSDQDDAKIVELITRHQVPLYAYIMSLLYRSADAQDVLQETNLVLWEKRAKAPRDEAFQSWACTVAYYQVLSYRKRNQRSRLFFSDEVIKNVAATIAEKPSLTASKDEALRQCLQGLPNESRTLLKNRYFSRLPVAEIAREMQRSSKAVSQSLYRIRKQLLGCVQARLRAMEGGLE